MKLKKGQCLQDGHLEDLEKRLIKKILSNRPQDHQKDVSEVMEVINHLMQTQAMIKSFGKLD